MLSHADSMKHRTDRDYQLQWPSSPNPNGVVSIVFRHNGPMRLMRCFVRPSFIPGHLLHTERKVHTWNKMVQSAKVPWTVHSVEYLFLWNFSFVEFSLLKKETMKEILFPNNRA